jgi:hypothetical protein
MQALIIGIAARSHGERSAAAGDSRAAAYIAARSKTLAQRRWRRRVRVHSLADSSNGDKSRDLRPTLLTAFNLPFHESLGFTSRRRASARAIYSIIQLENIIARTSIIIFSSRCFHLSGSSSLRVDRYHALVRARETRVALTTRGIRTLNLRIIYGAIYFNVTILDKLYF